MKKTLLIIGISAALFSCKKVNDRKDFEKTDLTGNGILAGKVTKNQLTYNSNGTGFTTIQAPVAGVDVTARVNNSDLYPTSDNAQGQKNYFATTDANGDYSMDILSNADGVQARVVFPEWTGTYDTIVNGVVKTGLLNTYYFSYNSTTVWKGAKKQLDHNYDNGTTYGNPGDQQIGTAIVTGSVQIENYKSAGGGTVFCCGYNPVAAANLTMLLTYSDDPSTLTPKTYTTTTDVAGRYTFTVSSHVTNAGNAVVRFNDYVHTRDTTIYTNTSYTTITTASKAGKAGYWGNQSSTTWHITAGEVRIRDFYLNIWQFTAY